MAVDGLSCWDLNGNNAADPEEDVNIDGFYDTDDCRVSPDITAILERLQMLEDRLANFDSDEDGFSPNDGDCDDSNPAINPSATPDVDGDGIDSNCDGVDGDADPGPDPAFIAEVLAAHNSVRASAEPPPSPALEPLTWDSALAATAQSWANQCQFWHNPNRSDDFPEYIGENIAATTSTAPSVSNIIDGWANEAMFYTYDPNSCEEGEVCGICTSPPGKSCGHYTQMVWDDTTAVGCGIATCQVLKGTQWTDPAQFLVCNYRPGGNYVGELPYETD